MLVTSEYEQHRFCYNSFIRFGFLVLLFLFNYIDYFIHDLRCENNLYIQLLVFNCNDRISL